VLLLTETVPALAAGEVYEVALSLGRMFPAGTALYLSVTTNVGAVVTPAEGCTVP
jgi:hypothetical protein